MTDLDLNTLVLSWVTTYGSPMVAAVLLLLLSKYQIQQRRREIGFKQNQR